ncbi:MAG: ankyrin repeat domain-containing protein [Rhizobiales bacterium]|nr:ankyrin repeat domain-containing protein [Hyphomicrobiales bacterium]
MIRRIAAPAILWMAMIAVTLGFADTLSAQTPPNERDLRIYAGLHAAAAYGNVAEIERLIGDGERPNIQDSNSRTPLHVAVYQKHHAAARALLRLGANPNALDAQRYDVVTIAAVHNDIEMLNIVLEGGASARNVTSPYDGTALITAAHLGHVDVVRILIAHKAPLDHANMRGWTALHEAVVLGNGGPNHVATVDALVKAGADPDIKDRRGFTAIMYARQRRYDEIIKILEPVRGRRS